MWGPLIPQKQICSFVSQEFVIICMVYLFLFIDLYYTFIYSEVSYANKYKFNIVFIFYVMGRSQVMLLQDI